MRESVTVEEQTGPTLMSRPGLSHPSSQRGAAVRGQIADAKQALVKRRAVPIEFCRLTVRIVDRSKAPAAF